MAADKQTVMLSQGKTPLHMAAMMGHKSSAEALIAHAAQLTAADMQVTVIPLLIHLLLLVPCS